MKGDLEARTSNPKDIPIRRTVLDGIKARHAAVEAAQDPIATAKEMAYLSHLDRRDLLDEIERLTRERDTLGEVVRQLDWVGKQRDRLRAALNDLIRAYVNLLEAGKDRITSLGGDCDPVDVMERADPHLRKARAVLSGEPASAVETEDRRTVFEKARDAALDVVRQTTGQQRFYAERALSLLVEAMRGTPCTDSAVNGKGD